MINKEIFHPISMADREWIQDILKNEYLEICDQTFGVSYAGKYTYNIQVANVSGCVVYRYDEGDFHSFSYPVGKNTEKAVIEIIDYIRESDEEIGISPVTFSQRQQLISLGIDDLMIEPLTDYFDYVYLADDLKYLKGSRYSAKRNHINRFTESSDWSHEALSHENAAECLELVEQWRMKKESSEDNAESDDSELIAEELEIKRSLEKLDELGFFGSVIRRDGKIIAFSICEAQNKDTMIVHYEKADADIQGAYQIINRETVLNADEFTYVNREDDLGIKGLRKAKESYYPYYMGRKYSVCISDVVFADEKSIDDLKRLWKQAFSDDDEYIAEYFGYLMMNNNIKQQWLNESVLVIKKDNSIAAMGSFFDGQIEDTNVKYLYGLATAENYRLQGMSRKIIEFARMYYDCPIVLKPGSEDLQSMYKKLGFRPLSSESLLTLTDEIFKRSNGEIIDECDYTEGLMIYA